MRDHDSDGDRDDVDGDHDDIDADDDGYYESDYVSFFAHLWTLFLW